MNTIEAAAPRPVFEAVKQGFFGRCPACGQGAMFMRYLKVAENCPCCGEALHHQRADDAPPYITILITGHVIGAMMLLVEETWPDAPIWLHALIWPTLTLMLALWLLPRAKGCLIAYQWALRMHGFGAESDLREGERAPA